MTIDLLILCKGYNKNLYVHDANDYYVSAGIWFMPTGI
jgi:hypothetical protein